MGIVFILKFIPIFYEYGITIIEINVEKSEIINLTEKIGNEYEKEHTRIKIISDNEFLFFQRYIMPPKTALIFPYFVNKCIIMNGGYKIISKIPLTYMLFPLIFIIHFIMEQGFSENIKISLLSILFFIVFHLIAHNWKMKFMLNDVEKFIRGVEL
jgi:hypothetical protein